MPDNQDQFSGVSERLNKHEKHVLIVYPDDSTAFHDVASGVLGQKRMSLKNMSRFAPRCVRSVGTMRKRLHLKRSQSHAMDRKRLTA